MFFSLHICDYQNHSHAILKTPKCHKYDKQDTNRKHFRGVILFFWFFFFKLWTSNQQTDWDGNIYPLLVKWHGIYPGLGAVIMQLGCNFLQLHIHRCEGFHLFLLWKHEIFKRVMATFVWTCWRCFQHAFLHSAYLLSNIWAMKLGFSVGNCRSYKRLCWNVKSESAEQRIRVENKMV